ncbi:MAG TPA: hypothetical protein VFN35_31715 [Ktedonobacteraceae bacterium]|nr:hypothetical protein [Ktedonobacteraceae bacterium]
MKREKTRLGELRAMPFKEYITTPEWQETQKAALKRAGNQCQLCRATGVALNAYHTTYENVGCELETDLLVLCAGCYDLLIQQRRLQQPQTKRQANNVAHTTQEADEQVVPNFSFGHKAAIFAPSALIGLGLPALLHAPLPAEIFGLAAAIALAMKSPKIYAEIRGSLPEGVVEFLDKRAEQKQAARARGEWSWADRFWGRHLYEHTPESAHYEDESDEAADEDFVEGFQDHLDLAPTLKPHADRLLSGRKVILGVSGSGKTNTMNVYIEELGGLKPAPAVILFDTDDENRAICDKKYWPNPAWLDKEWGLTKDNAFEMAQTILEERYQCVINLQSYDEEEAAWIMIHMIKGVQLWQEAREIRIPCEIVLDEASVWLPQNPRESSLSSVLVDDPDPQTDEENKKISLLALLQRAYFRTIVRRGRRRGMGFTLAAQRIAEIDKRALQGSWMFLMRQTQPADWREYKEFGITPEEARGLLDGEAYVFAPGSTREKHRLRESRSPHGGITPGLKALRGQRTPKAAPESQIPVSEAGKLVATAAKAPSELSAAGPESAIDALLRLRDQVDEQTFLALIGTLATNSPKSAVEDAVQQLVHQSAARSDSVEPANSVASHRRSSTGLPGEVHAALAVLQPGMTYRDLAVKLGYTDGVARELWQELRKRGLLCQPAQAEVMEKRPTLYSLPRSSNVTQEAHPKEPKKRTFGSVDIARGFALWAAGASSTRKLEAAAKEAGYGWSNGFCRDLIDEMEAQGLIPKRERGAV